MGYREDLLKNRYGFRDPQTTNILKVLNDARDLCKGIFPGIEPVHIEQMLCLCAQNGGLALSPIEKPEFLFASFRYWPQIVDAVENWDIRTLYYCNLRGGPILHIAALVTPTRGYRLTREIINILNPLGVSCHRYKRDGYTFHFKRNPRFDKGRIKHGSVYQNCN